MRVAEAGIFGQSCLASRLSLYYRANLPAGSDAEVDGRSDPLSSQGDAMTRRVATEEDLSVGGATDPVGYPVALITDAFLTEILCQELGRLPHVELGIE